MPVKKGLPAAMCAFGPRTPWQTWTASLLCPLSSVLAPGLHAKPSCVPPAIFRVTALPLQRSGRNAWGDPNVVLEQ